MEIYLIRHTAPLITKGMIYGRTNVPLAESFEDEKQRVLSQLPALLDAVYSSPSIRCTQLAAALSTNYLVDEALYELNFGDWEGETWDTIDRAASETWMNDFVNLAPPNGETMLEMETRVLKFWDNLLQSRLAHVALVTHAGVIRILLAKQQSIALKDSFSIQVGMAKVFRLSVSTP